MGRQDPESDVSMHEAVSVIHQVPKSAACIISLVDQIIERSAESDLVVRDALKIRQFAVDSSSAAIEFLESFAVCAEESETTLAHAIGCAISDANRVHPDRFVITELKGRDRIYVDRRLRSVLANLLDNAMHFDEEGRPVLLEAFVQPDRVVIQVTDYGSGMSADTLARCREPGFSTRTDGLGSGIGLSVAQEFLRGMGGGLEIETQEGFGTRVRVTVPVDAG